jgi:hypothetical protein
MWQLTEVSNWLREDLLLEKQSLGHIKQNIQYNISRAQYSVVLKLLKQEVNVITEFAELKIEVEDNVEQLDDGRGKDQNKNPLNEGHLLECYQFLKNSYTINEHMVHLASLMTTAKVCRNPPHVIKHFAPYKEQVIKKIEEKAEQIRGKREEEYNKELLQTLNILNNKEDITVEFDDGMIIKIDGAKDWWPFKDSTDSGK